MPTISVIVPVHNIENYIVRCLESIDRQTFKDFECIIVENASSDRTLEIAAGYIKGKERFKLVSVKEPGVSNARNVGLSLSLSDYIAFIDGDDYVSVDYLESLLAGMAQPDADMAIVPYLYVKNSDFRGRACGCSFPPAGIYNLGSGGSSLALDYIFVSGRVCWGKLLKSSIIKDNDVRFDCALRYVEDFLFVVQYLSCCRNVSFMDKGLYYYFMGRSDNASSNVGSPLWAEQELGVCIKLVNVGGGILSDYTARRVVTFLLGEKFGSSIIAKLPDYGENLIKGYKDVLLNIDLSPQIPGKALRIEWRFYKFLLRNNIFKFYPKAARILRNVLMIFKIRLR